MKMKYWVMILVLVLLSATRAEAQTQSSVKELEENFVKCSDNFTNESSKCSETWSMKCYNFLTDLHHKTRDCYKEVGKQVLKQHYGLSDKEAEGQLNEYSNYTYNKYLFIYADSNYCRENNCGVSPYLYSEYATSKALEDYIGAMISSVSSRE